MKNSKGKHFINMYVCHSATLFLRLVVPKRIPNINVGLYNLSPIVASPRNMNDLVHKKVDGSFSKLISLEL